MTNFWVGFTAGITVSFIVVVASVIYAVYRSDPEDEK